MSLQLQPVPRSPSSRHALDCAYAWIAYVRECQGCQPARAQTCSRLQIFNLETRYIATANPQGNALKGAPSRARLCLRRRRHTEQRLLTPLAALRAGYEGFLTQTNAPARRGPVKPEERLFSSSSVTGASHLPA